MAFDDFGQGASFAEWSQNIHDIMDEMLKRSFVRFRDTGTWQPATNVYETRDAYFICVELAGVDREQIDLRCCDHTRISIRGRREQPRPEGVEGPLSVHALEIDEGPFSREIELPEPVEVEQVDAKYSEGYLWITVPKTTIE
jgi:HSP20 family protein